MSKRGRSETNQIQTFPSHQSKHGTQSSIKLDQCLTFWAEENYRKSKQRCHRPTSWVWSTGEKSHTACTRNLQTAMPLWAKSGFSGMTKRLTTSVYCLILTHDSKGIKIIHNAANFGNFRKVWDSKLCPLTICSTNVPFYRF